MNKLFSRILLILLLSPLTFMFNNCSKSSGALVLQSTDFASQDPQSDAQLIAGKTLYTTNCSSCHGDFANSTKLGKAASDISSAIATQPQMSFLSHLTPTEIGQIAYALEALSQAPPPEDTSTAQYLGLSVNRSMLKSNLQEIFVTDGTPDASDTAINTSIQNLVNGRPEAFGGNCSRNDPGCIASCGTSGDSTCVGLYDVITNASPTPAVNVVTQGYLEQVCEQILSVDKATQTALSKAGVVSMVAPNATDVTTVFRFFNREKPVDTASVNALIDVSDQARQKGYSVLDQWRFLLLPLCASTSGQML